MHLHYYYGIRYPKTLFSMELGTPKTILNRVFWVPNCIMVMQMDPLGRVLQGGGGVQGAFKGVRLRVEG